MKQHRVTEIISDAAIESVHAYANFGAMTKRQVVNEGVLKYACGYTGGSTQLHILLDHGLVRKPRAGRYETILTVKGIKYLGAMFRDAGFSTISKALAPTEEST